MIPQNELRIGNLVSVPFNDTVTVLIIRDDQGPGIMVNECSSYFHMDTVDPIPITEDWLIRLGFEKGGPNAFATNYHIGRFSVSRHFKDGLYYSWTAIIKHIHQLQNLYFAITGKELELK